MRLLKSIRRGRRDWRLLLRTNFCAVVVTISATIAICCSLSTDDIGFLLRDLFVVSFIGTVVLSWWMERNRRLALEIRRSMFRYAHSLCNPDEQQRWYAIANTWLNENFISIRQLAPWIWGSDNVRALEELQSAVARRARCLQHTELCMYRSLLLADQKEMERTLDKREEMPSHYETWKGADPHFSNRWLFMCIFMYFMLTWLLALPPFASTKSKAKQGDSATHQIGPTSRE